MSSPDLQATVGQLVAERPGRSRVFERYGIDYCCGGKVPIAQACRERGLDVTEVLRELDVCDAETTAGDEVAWSERPLGELADHIVAVHHGYLRRELPRLTIHLDKIAAVHGPGNPALVEVRDVFAGLREELESHLLKEEQVLFPMIKQLDTASRQPDFHCGSVRFPIQVMEHEHDDAGAALVRLRALTVGYTPPAEACNTYRAALAGLAELEADLHRHIHKENNILFPRAQEAEAALAGRA